VKVIPEKNFQLPVTFIKHECCVRKWSVYAPFFLPFFWHYFFVSINGNVDEFFLKRIL